MHLSRAPRRTRRLGIPGLGFLRDLLRRVGYGMGPRLMSYIRKRWVLLRHPHADVRFEGPVHIGPGFSLHIPDGGSFIVGPCVEFRRGFRAEIARGGRVVIGAHARMTYDVLIQCSTSIEIGEYCGLGQCAYVADGFHRYRGLDRPVIEQGYDFRPIRIHDGAVALTKCTILNDLGKRAMIAANSVVTNPIPPYTLAAGVPARVIDYFGPEGGEPEELVRRASSDGSD